MCCLKFLIWFQQCIIYLTRSSQTDEIVVDKFMWIPGYFMDLLYLGEPDIM